MRLKDAGDHLNYHPTLINTALRVTILFNGVDQITTGCNITEIVLRILDCLFLANPIRTDARPGFAAPPW